MTTEKKSRLASTTHTFWDRNHKMAHSATQSDQILLSFFKDKDFNFKDQVGYTRSHEVLVMDDGSMNLKIVFGNQDYCAELVVPLDAILQTVAGCQKHYDLNGGRDKCLKQWGVKNPVSDPLAAFEKEAAAPELLAACEAALAMVQAAGNNLGMAIEALGAYMAERKAAVA